MTPRRILITRPEPDASDWRTQFEARGAQVTIDPLLEIELLPPQTANLTGVQALIATSRNALRALQNSPILPQAATLPIFTVGPATTQLARDLGFTATVYVVTDWVGRTNDWPGQPPTVPRWPLMNWDDLGALVGEGATLGAHTANHPRLPLLTRDAQDHEMGRSVDAISRATGRAPLTLAYPYGATDAAVSAIALGHVEAAYGTRLSFVSSGSARAELPRIDACYLADGRRADRLDRADMRAYLSFRNLGRQLRAALGG